MIEKTRIVVALSLLGCRPAPPVVHGFQCNWEDTLALRWARELVDSGYHLTTWWYDSTGRAWVASGIQQQGCLAGFENQELQTKLHTSRPIP